MLPSAATRPTHAPRNKHEFYERWLRCEFGNRPECWASLEDLKQSGYEGKFSIRSRTPGGKLETKQDLHAGIHPSFGVVYQATLPDEFLVMQASLGRDAMQRGLWMEYCLEPNIHFREAMNRAKFARGIEAKLVLRAHVDAASLEDILEMLDEYPNAVIEFATYRVNVGVLPKRRTVIFEVREY